MRWLHCLFTVATLIVVSPCAATGRAHAQAAAADARARSTFEAGRAAFEDGRFDEALGLYEHAYRISPRPDMLFNIARAAEETGNDERAIEAYSAYMEARPDAPNRGYVRARLRKLTARTSAHRASLRSSASSPVRGEPPAPAARVGKLRVYGGLGLAFGGHAQSSYDDSELSLAPSFGLQAGAGFVWRVFGILAELQWARLRVASDDIEAGWYPEDKRGQSIFLIIKPRLGYQFRTVPLELYIAVPHGAGLSGLGGDDGGEITVGALAGASVFLRDSFAINGELGPEWTTFHTYGGRATLRLNAMLRF